LPLLLQVKERMNDAYTVSSSEAGPGMVSGRSADACSAGPSL
jgi:hypothetical protein